MTETEEQAKYYKDRKKLKAYIAMQMQGTQPMTEESLRTFDSSRSILPERWDLLPAIALREVAEIMYRGQDKHPQDDWKDIDFLSEQSPLNRAIAHAYKATEMAPRSKERTRQLAKATVRLLMQIWWELQEEEGNKDENNS